MNCQEFEAIVVDLARRRPLEASLRESGREHAEACTTCAALLRDQRALSAGLLALAESTAAAQASAGLEAALKSAFRAQAALPEGPPVWRGSWKAWALAAAACLVLGAALAIRMVPAPERPIAKPRPTVPASRPILADAVPDPVERPPARKARMVRRRNRVAGRLVRPAEIVAPQEPGFVPLLYGSAPTPLEGGQVVRLRLPRATLAALGLPTNAGRGDTVQADVLFTEDGMARAIRFVP